MPQIGTDAGRSCVIPPMHSRDMDTSNDEWCISVRLTLDYPLSRCLLSLRLAIFCRYVQIPTRLRDQYCIGCCNDCDTQMVSHTPLVSEECRACSTWRSFSRGRHESLATLPSGKCSFLHRRCSFVGISGPAVFIPQPAMSCTLRFQDAVFFFPVRKRLRG
jgi:hypothetical protein